MRNAPVHLQSSPSPVLVLVTAPSGPSLAYFHGLILFPPHIIILFTPSALSLNSPLPSPPPPPPPPLAYRECEVIPVRYTVQTVVCKGHQISSALTPFPHMMCAIWWSVLLQCIVGPRGLNFHSPVNFQHLASPER